MVGGGSRIEAKDYDVNLGVFLRFISLDIYGCLLPIFFITLEGLDLHLPSCFGSFLDLFYFTSSLYFVLSNRR